MHPWRTLFEVKRFQRRDRPGERVHLPAELLRRVYLRDRGRCQICQREVGPREWEADHVVPIARGGGNEITNLRVACRKCNRGRRD